MKIEVVNPKLNERREVDPKGNNSQINPSTETHKGMVEEGLFETPMSWSIRESITTNTTQHFIPARKDTCAKSNLTAEADDDIKQEVRREPQDHGN